MKNGWLCGLNTNDAESLNRVWSSTNSIGKSSTYLFDNQTWNCPRFTSGLKKPYLIINKNIHMGYTYAHARKGRKEGNVLFNDALNTFYLRLYGVREETRCCYIGYSFRLAARLLLYAPSHRQDSTYHGLCYTSRGALAETRNSSMGPPHEGLIRGPIAPWTNALTTELHLAPARKEGPKNSKIIIIVDDDDDDDDDDELRKQKREQS